MCDKLNGTYFWGSKLLNSLTFLFPLFICIIILPNAAPQPFPITGTPIVPNSTLSGITQQNFFKFIFPPDYDSNTRPFTNWTIPVPVETLLRLNLLYNVDSENQVFSLDIFTKEIWTDWRLSFNASLWPYPNSMIRIPETLIWKPDLFFMSALTCSVLNSLIYLDTSGSGLLTWSRHQVCVFHNDFDLHFFPFDSQDFALRRLSFSYNELELKVYFPSTCFWPSPLLDYSSSLWVLTTYSCANDTYHFRDGQADYDAPITVLNVARTWQNYIVKMILPMFSIVLLSTLSFWVDPKSAPARVAFSVSLILSIVTFNLLVSQGLPKVNYSTLLDWYVWYCFLYVIMAMGEFCVVSSLLSSKNSDPELGLILDDFCQWVVGPMWIMSNLVFWPPLLPNDAVRGLVSTCSGFYIFMNVWRCYWNYQNKKKGMRAAFFTLVKHSKQKYEEIILKKQHTTIQLTESDLTPFANLNREHLTFDSTPASNQANNNNTKDEKVEPVFGPSSDLNNNNNVGSSLSANDDHNEFSKLQEDNGSSSDNDDQNPFLSDSSDYKPASTITEHERDAL